MKIYVNLLLLFLLRTSSDWQIRFATSYGFYCVFNYIACWNGTWMHSRRLLKISNNYLGISKFLSVFALAYFISCLPSMPDSPTSLRHYCILEWKPNPFIWKIEVIGFLTTGLSRQSPLPIHNIKYRFLIDINYISCVNQLWQLWIPKNTWLSIPPLGWKKFI